MTAQPSPTLDFAAVLAIKAFDEDDLAHNRRGVLSAKQRAWCEANPIAPSKKKSRSKEEE